MKVSFVLLAHEEPELLRGGIETLLASGSDVYVHHDAKCPQDLQVAAGSWNLERFPGKLFHATRVSVEWGEWSIVQGTLNCLELARKQGYGADYFMLISGSCMPIKPIFELEDFLHKNTGTDFIEVVNALENRWITKGIQQERWELFHYINWRTHPDLFSRIIALQKRLKVRRVVPLSHIPHMGSQWWCLRASTIDAILGLIDSHPELIKFYRRTWVPDELFFQTMVGNLIPHGKISAQILLRYKFNSCGVPRVYYDDDLPELLAESTFFARKISYRAHKLREALSRICMMEKPQFLALLGETGDSRAQQLRERLELKRVMHKQQWFGLVTSYINEYDYIKAIPNSMVVVVSNNEQAVAIALEELRSLTDAEVYGQILGGARLDFGIRDKVAGYGSATIVAQRNWHQFIGDLAFHAPGKALVFALAGNPASYLNVLRWKANLMVLMLDDLSEVDLRQLSLSELGQEMYAAEKGRNHSDINEILYDKHCKMHRITFDTLEGDGKDEFVRTMHLVKQAIRNELDDLGPLRLDKARIVGRS